MKTNFLKILIASSITLPIFLNAADWNLIQDFSSGAEGFDLTLARNNSGELIVTEDLTDSTNQVLYVESGNYGVTDHNDTYATITLPESVPDGSTITVYWRYYQTGTGNSFHLALTDVAKATDSGTGDWIAPSAWGDMESIFRINVGEVSIRDESKYPLMGTGQDADSFVPFTMGNDIWYEFWMVVNNAEGSFNDDYSVYVRGGGFTEITKLQIQELDQSSGEPSGNYFDTAYFRNGTTDDLVNLLLATGSGAAADPVSGDPWFIDDIYYVMDAVADESPLGGGPVVDDNWAGYPIVDDVGNVDTEGLFGWINVIEKPYIFSYSLNSYMYVKEEFVSNTGSWAYIYK